MKKGIVILGSTGSIGRSTLEVVANQRDEFEVVGLACRENVRLFSEQIRRFKPRFACLFDEELASEVDFGACPEADRPGGHEGARQDGRGDGRQRPSRKHRTRADDRGARSCGKVLGLANKESLVMAGRLISSAHEKQDGAASSPLTANTPRSIS